MQFVRGNQDDVSVLRLIGCRLADVMNISLQKDNQFIVIVVMQSGGIGLPIILRTPKGIKEGIIQIVFAPVDDFGMRFGCIWTVEKLRASGSM